MLARCLIRLFSQVRSRIIKPPIVSTSNWRRTFRPATYRTSSRAAVYTIFRGAKGRAHALHGIIDVIAGGWRLGGVVRIQSGSPLSVTQATNQNAIFGFGIQRPNISGNPTLPSDVRNTGPFLRYLGFLSGRTVHTRYRIAQPCHWTWISRGGRDGGQDIRNHGALPRWSSVRKHST